MKPEINHHIELVQILIYLSDVKNMTRQSLTNTVYCSEIDKWFSSYRDHPAIIMTRDLIINHHFNYARPHKAALRFDEIADNKNDKLNNWAITVKHFVIDSLFDCFFECQKEYYNWILNTIDNCDFDMWTSYIEKYFQCKPDDYHLIICPLDGNYGFNTELSRGKNVSYTIRCEPYYNNGIPIWQFDFFAKGIAHEYAHCFVNPIVESHTDMLKKHSSFFKSHTNMLDYYNTFYAVINEYFVRAFAIRFMEQWNFKGFDVIAEYDRQRECFIYIDLFVNELKSFEKEHIPFQQFYLANIERIISMADNSK